MALDCFTITFPGFRELEVSAKSILWKSHKIFYISVWNTLPIKFQIYMLYFGFQNIKLVTSEEAKYCYFKFEKHFFFLENELAIYENSKEKYIFRAYSTYIFWTPITTISLV